MMMYCGLTALAQIAALRPASRYYAAKAVEDGIVALVTLAVIKFASVAVFCGLVMVVPWCFIVWLARRLGRTDALYFVVSGALGALVVIGALLAALLPPDGMPVIGRFALILSGDGPALLPFGGLWGLSYWRVMIAPKHPDQRGLAPSAA